MIAQGDDWACRSASIWRAVSSSAGTIRPRIATMLTRLAWADTLMAAVPTLAAPRIGAATARRALFEFLVDDRVSLAPHLADERPEPVRVGDGPRGEPLERGLGEVPVEFVIGQRREQHPPHRRGVGGEPGSHRDRDGHDALGGHAGHVDDLVTIENRDRRGLMQPGDEFLQVRRGHLRQRQPGQVGIAELEHPRPQRELPAVVADVTELDQGQQEPARRRPGQARRLGDLAQAQPLSVRPERPDHRQPAVQRLDEVTVPCGRSARPALPRKRISSGGVVRCAHRGCHRGAC